MPRRTQLSRADLLDCLRIHGEDHLDAFAAALGYVRPEQEPKPPARRQPAPPPSVKADRAAAVSVPTAKPKAHFYRVVAHRQLEPEEVVREVPAWLKAGKPFQNTDELSAPTGLTPPPQAPLMPWPRLWPFLKTALSHQQPLQALDLPRIVARLARVQALQRLPRKRRRSWADQCQVIVDYAPPLLPFWTDFNGLYHHLFELRGQQGLELIAFPNGVPSDECWLWVGKTWREIDAYPMPKAGRPVLVLSDLGCVDSSEFRRRHWRRFGLCLHRAGCRPLALMPCPPRWWDRELVERFYPVYWDRGERPPRRLDTRPRVPAPLNRPPEDPGAERLLALLAPAIRVEPALLRAARYLLPVQAADVGSEAAVWNHPNVHATPLAFYYASEAIVQYRKRFPKENQNLRRRIAELIITHHAHLSPAIAYEEQLLLADLNQTQQPDAQEFMERIVKTLMSQRNVLTESLEAWVERLTPRQHPAMWRNDALAAAWGAAQLAQLRQDGQITCPPGFQLSRISWLLALEKMPQRYILRQRGQRLYLETEADAAASSAGDLDAPGSPVANISATAPGIQTQRVEAEGSAGDGQILSVDQAISLPFSGRLQLCSDHEELILDSLSRPEWVETIGRDEQGLFVAWQEGQRRARWINPGPYPVIDRAGGRLDQLTLTHGCWRDEAEALAQLREGFPQPEWAQAYGLDDYGLYADFRVKGVVQRLRWIAPGEFLMGSPEREAEQFDTETQHRVILTRGYWLADTACTQALWQAVMRDNPSGFKGEDRPVEQVSWEEVQTFIEQLNNIVPGDRFRLPTEAEWEYACRAGTATPFWFGDQITPEQANYNGNYPYAGGQKGAYRQETVPVKALPCNSWGLYQMHGNVWEWCQDWYGSYPAETVVDPIGPAQGGRRVLRGGSWFNFGGFVRSASRFRSDPGYRFGSGGFRLARGQAIQAGEPEASEIAQGSRGGQPPGSGGGLVRRLLRGLGKKQ